MKPALNRIIDILLSLLALVAMAPLFLVIALSVRLFLGSPILFRQIRPGLNGKLFGLYKFRTMMDLRDERGYFLPDEKRISGIGKFLRKTSLDELPELWNVMKGDMSIVGPRPLLPQYLPRYTAEQARRHEVKPGLTGWAQINGRNAISWEEKFKLDVWYVDNCSIWLDLKIIALTIVKVLSGEGITAPGEATMPEFMGTPSSEAKENNA